MTSDRSGECPRRPNTSDWKSFVFPAGEPEPVAAVAAASEVAAAVDASSSS